MPLLPPRSSHLRGTSKLSGLALLTSMLVAPCLVQAQVGEEPALVRRITQAEVEAARTSLQVHRLRQAGLQVFATPFNLLDGYGDGPSDPANPTARGSRPKIQNPDTPFLRFNGLDAQTCLECHGVLTFDQVPAINAPGGTAGFSASPFPNVTRIDGADADGNGVAEVNGRVINPPINFGGGGISLLGKEMTKELQRLKAIAIANPGTPVRLVAKGVDFGSLLCATGGVCDTSGVEGIDADLVVRPFGRKGEFETTRAFDLGATQFHLGMQPVEVVGEGVDADGDGVVNELTVGELSALSLFLEGLEPPAQIPGVLRGVAADGFELFQQIGCADCHIPELTTDTPIQTLSFPEVPTDPDANVYQRLDLRRHGFPRDRSGPGVVVALFADLKRHDMGDRLAESAGSPLDRLFTTARLWGVADTAPYLHDGRALTLSDAILFHDGEGRNASDAFAALSDQDRSALLSFLRTLRNPIRPNRGL